MNINKELDELLNDPIFEVSNTEATLFELTEAMKRAKEERKAADYVAQRQPCEDFAEYEPLFTQVHNDLKNGRRNLVRISKTYSFETGRFYVVSGQILYLESVKALKKGGNGSVDGRTRCIYENGTESDILLQTLRKNVVGDGYAITETEEEIHLCAFVSLRQSGHQRTERPLQDRLLHHHSGATNGQRRKRPYLSDGSRKDCGRLQGGEPSFTTV